MKTSEFRALIREEVSRILNEASYDYKAIEKLIKGKVSTYKVGAGTRQGANVNVNTLKSIISKNIPDIYILEKNGVTFTKAFVNVKTLEPTYGATFQKKGPALTFSLFGTDVNGNDIVYDRYEGDTVGGRQISIFVNGKKQKASDYIANLDDDSTELLELISKIIGHNVSAPNGADASPNYVSLYITKVSLVDFEALKAKQKILSNFWAKFNLRKSIVFYSKNALYIHSNKQTIAQHKDGPNSFMLG
jgi:hypothetical protein